MGLIAEILGFLVALLLIPFLLERAPWLAILLTILSVIMAALIGAHVHQKKHDREAGRRWFPPGPSS